MTDIYLIPPVLSLICGLYLAVLALTKGPLTKDRILFALVCLWYTLLAPLFISHHLVSDRALILAIERKVHLIYVYLPVIQILYFHCILSLRRNGVVAATLGLSFVFSLSTLGDHYFYGLNQFEWGYIARGGVAFQLFGLYCAATLAYSFYCFARQLKVETDPHLRLKYQYTLFAFGLTALLTMMNIPAIVGIDFYPAGNFGFIPLFIFAYGLLKYRLLEFRKLLHIAGVRLILAVLILVPNYYLFGWFKPYLVGLSNLVYLTVVIAWVLLVYFYISRIQNLMDRWFHRSRYDLRRAEARLIREMLVLRSSGDLVQKVTEAIGRSLPFKWSKIYIFDQQSNSISKPSGSSYRVPMPLVQWFTGSPAIIERLSIKRLALATELKEALVQLLSDLNATYAVALLHKDVFIGLLVLPDKADSRWIEPDEANFLTKISGTLSLALSNAEMYQRISALKDRLQTRTAALSDEIRERSQTEKTLKSVQDELQFANLELEKAILHANEMTSKAEIGNHVLSQEMEDRKRIESALRESEERYRLIAENSTDVIWTLDMDTRFTYISPSVKHLLGRTSKEMMQMDLSELLTAESLERAKALLAEELVATLHTYGSGPEFRTIEIEMIREDGTTVCTEVTTRFMRDGNDNVVGILGVSRDITIRKKSEQDLIYMAYHDTLTGLYNRKAFMEMLEGDVKYAKRYNSGLALLFFDLNKFKLVNDTYGHETGDRLLKTVSERLAAAVRETDHIARLGGDEFTIVLKNPEKIYPERVARRIVTDLSTPFVLNGTEIDYVTASIGIAIFPKDGETVEALIRSADLAMYEAKKTDTDWLHYSEKMASAF